MLDSDADRTISLAEFVSVFGRSKAPSAHPPTAPGAAAGSAAIGVAVLAAGLASRPTLAAVASVDLEAPS